MQRRYKVGNIDGLSNAAVFDVFLYYTPRRTNELALTEKQGKASSSQNTFKDLNSWSWFWITEDCSDALLKYFSIVLAALGDIMFLLDLYEERDLPRDIYLQISLYVRVFYFLFMSSLCTRIMLLLWSEETAIVANDTWMLSGTESYFCTYRNRSQRTERRMFISEMIRKSFMHFTTRDYCRMWLCSHD